MSPFNLLNFRESPSSSERRMPMTLVAAAKPYLKELRQAVDQSRVQVIMAEFERAVSLAVEHRPDLILVASPPIGDVVQTCQCLLENGSTRNIPIFLIFLDCNTNPADPSSLREATLRAGASECPCGATPRGDKKQFVHDDQSMTNGSRQKQLLSILDLLHYAEAEVAELGIETSSALLRATIADVDQHLE